MPVGLAAADATLLAVGLTTGVAAVSRGLEGFLAAAAAAAIFLTMAISLSWLFAWSPIARFSRYRVAAVTAMLGLALVLAVVVVRPSTSTRPTRPTKVAAVTLTKTERITIERDIRELRREGHPQVAASLSSILAIGGAIGVGLLGEEASVVEGVGGAGAAAASTLIGVLTRVRPNLSLNTTFRPNLSLNSTFRIDHPTLTLGGLHLAFAPKTAPPAGPALNIHRGALSLGPIQLNRFYVRRKSPPTVDVHRGAFSLGTIQLNRFYIRRRSPLLPHTP